MVEGGIFGRLAVVALLLSPALLACAPSSTVTRNDLNCEGVISEVQPANSLPPLEPVEAVSTRTEGEFQRVILTTAQTNLTALPPAGPYMEYRNFAKVYPVGSDTTAWSVTTESVASREFLIPPQAGNVCVEVYRARVPKDSRLPLPPVRITRPRYIGLQGSKYPSR